MNYAEAEKMLKGCGQEHVLAYWKKLNKKEEARRLTRETLKLLSDEIMKSPGDWYWFNKRWILEPV